MPDISFSPLAVITLPVLAPIAALLQLLFPGLLRDQWRQYRVAVYVLMTQTTLMCVPWLVQLIGGPDAAPWLTENLMAVAMLAVAAVGIVVSLAFHWRSKEAISAASRPTKVEYIAFSLFAAIGLIWGGYQRATGASPLDAMAPVTLAAAVGFAHLMLRRRQLARGASGRSLLTTELVFLLTLCVSGAAFAWYTNREAANLAGGTVEHEWPTFRGNARRTGADSAAGGPKNPKLLWTFEPREPRGRVYLHSSPTARDGLVFVGGRHQVLTNEKGIVYCINDLPGRESGDRRLAQGDLVWRFTANNSMKPVFCSPTVAEGKLFIGEGYHQNSKCRIFCLDVRQGNEALWEHETASHTESTPSVHQGRLYAGAGDDGVICLELSPQSPGGSPRQLWNTPELHVDASPLVVDKRVFVGTVIGDRFTSTEAVAIDADSGNVLWRVPCPLPVPGSPALGEGRILFGLGNGKMDSDDDDPAGGVLALDPKDGKKHWEFRAEGAVLNAPAVADNRVIFTCRDKRVYALDEATGNPVWKTDLDEPMVTAPVVSGNQVFVVTVTGTVACLDLATGDVSWKFTDLRVDEDDAYASPMLSGGKLYIALGGKVHCLADASEQP